MISFITPVYNEENFLSSLFNCIEKNYHDFEFEWIFVIFGQHLAIYTVFYKESGSGVEKSKILDLGGEKLEKPT